MSVIKVKIQKDFTVLYNGVLENPDISFKAKGLWAYCMSRPDDWQFHVSHLATVSKEGESAIYAALKELKDHGLVEHKRIKNPLTGTYERGEYIIYPYPPKLKKCLPHRGFPDVGFPDVENRALLSTETLPRTEKKNKKKNLYLEKVLLTEDEYAKLLEKFGQEKTDAWIKDLNSYVSSTGKHYASHYHTILNWHERNLKSGKDGKSSSVEENQKLIAAVKGKYPHHPDIDYGDNYIDFKAFREIGYLKVSGNAFAEQVENNLRKMGLKI